MSSRLRAALSLLVTFGFSLTLYAVPGVPEIQFPPFNQPVPDPPNGVFVEDFVVWGTCNYDARVPINNQISVQVHPGAIPNLPLGCLPSLGLIGNCVSAFSGDPSEPESIQRPMCRPDGTWHVKDFDGDGQGDDFVFDISALIKNNCCQSEETCNLTIYTWYAVNLTIDGKSPFGQQPADFQFAVYTCGACAADLNDDGGVNAADLALLLGAWGPNPGGVADLNGDDQVNAADLALLLGAWGPCP